MSGSGAFRCDFDPVGGKNDDGYIGHSLGLPRLMETGGIPLEGFSFSLALHVCRPESIDAGSRIDVAERSRPRGKRIEILSEKPDFLHGSRSGDPVAVPVVFEAGSRVGRHDFYNRFIVAKQFYFLTFYRTDMYNFTFQFYLFPIYRLKLETRLSA